jgi:hypothetical protein
MGNFTIIDNPDKYDDEIIHEAFRRLRLSSGTPNVIIMSTTTYKYLKWDMNKDSGCYNAKNTMTLKQYRRYCGINKIRK